MKPKKIKITCIIGSLSRGGCETHLLKVMPKLDRNRFDVSIFIMFSPGDLCSAMEQSGIRVFSPKVPYKEIKIPLLSIIWKFLYISYILLRLFWHFIIFRPQIAHFFLPISYIVGFPVAFICKIKVSIMSRRSLNDYQIKNILIPKLEYLFHKYVDYILGNSKAVVNQLIEEEQVSPEKIKLIYNGVEPHAPTIDANTFRKTLGVDDKDIMIIIVANLIFYKGHKDLLEALALLKSNQSYKCFIIGYDTGIQTSLETLAKDLKVESNVIFTGKRNDTVNFYEAADISILCSHQEGFSNSILEAMAAGLPMIVTNAGGNAEAVHNNINGYLVDIKNAESLSKAIDILLESKNKRYSLGEKSKEIIEKDFRIEKCVLQYEQFYEKTII